MTDTITIPKSEFQSLVHEILFIRDMNQQLRHRLLISNSVIMWYNEFFVWYQSLNSILNSISPNVFLLAQSLLDLFPKLTKYLLDNQSKHQKEMETLIKKYCSYISDQKIEFDLFENNINQAAFDKMYNNIQIMNDFWNKNRDKLIYSSANTDSRALFVYKNISFNQEFENKFNLFAKECNIDLSPHEFYYTAVCSEFVWRFIRKLFVKAKIPLLDYQSSDFISSFDTTLHILIEKLENYWDKQVNVVCEPFKFVVDNVDGLIKNDMLIEMDNRQKVLFQNLPVTGLEKFYGITFKKDNTYLATVKQKYIDSLVGDKMHTIFNFKCFMCHNDIQKSEKLFVNKNAQVVCRLCDNTSLEFPIQEIHSSNTILQLQNLKELLKQNDKNYLINLSLFCEEENLLSRYLTNTATENRLLRNTLELIILKLYSSPQKYVLDPINDYLKELLKKL